MERSFKEMRAGRSILIDKNGNIIALARTMKVDFEKDVLKPLFNALRSDSLPAHCQSKYRKGLLALDDYSLARLM